MDILSIEWWILYGILVWIFIGIVAVGSHIGKILYKILDSKDQGAASTYDLKFVLEDIKAAIYDVEREIRVLGDKLGR